MSKQYYNRTLTITAKPRSRRLREAGVSSSSVTTSSHQSSSSAGGDIPLEDINKGVTAYGWGNHKNEGYLKTGEDIAEALGFMPASSAGNGLHRPQLRIVSGWRGDGHGGLEEMPDSLFAYHPLLEENIGAEFVLMHYNKRLVVNLSSEPDVHRPRRKRCWCEARGGLATDTPRTFGHTGITLDALREHILQKYMCIYGHNAPTTMTIAQFKNIPHRDYPARFGHVYEFGGAQSPDPTETETRFFELTRACALFGVAVRYPNPAFAALVDGPLAETTRALRDRRDDKLEPRYIYTDVAPIRVWVNTNSHYDCNYISFVLEKI